MSTRGRRTLSKILLEIAQFCHWTKILAKSCHLLAKYLLYLPNLNKCKLYLPNTCYKYLLDLPNLNKYKLYLPNTCYKYWILAKYLLNICPILAQFLPSTCPKSNFYQSYLILASTCHTRDPRTDSPLFLLWLLANEY